MYKSVQGTVDNKMHQPLEREKSEKRFEVVNIEESEPLSFLLMGVDARSTDRGRTDTIIVLTVNQNDNSMKMLSIPRDTRTEIIGRG
ncbi:LCP family protein, partial [Pseudomonas sp. 2995-3]|uniref:LCP family glycopolymer transferase n=1 Tax=Pseudomonas sp. 2995-3 TaxID=1712680 RepID=UPI001C47FFE3